MISKTAIEFHPIRQWKKRRRNRNMQQRMTRKRWYKKNKSKLKMKRKQRYKQLSKNPTWKRWQHKLRSEKSKRRLVASGASNTIFGIRVGERVWLGLLDSLDVDADMVRAVSVKTSRLVSIPLQVFLENACFADLELERAFWAVLESVYGSDETDPCTP